MTDKKEKKQESAWTTMTQEQIDAAYQFCTGYIDFLNQARTEREVTKYIIESALANGYESLDEVDELQLGQKILFTNKEKVSALVIVGKKSIKEGLNLVVSHVDSPRLDLKARPAYEADRMALFKTHYYGGIKKYQWVAMPLAMHGVVVKKDGTMIRLAIGDGDDDPVFTVSDLLPHLAKEQMEKKMSEGITGEGLNILMGSRPLEDSETEPIKAMVLKIMKDQYGIEEDDFTSAELELVPAFKSREVGIDRSMIGAYGQDDRVSAYTSLMAALEVENPERTTMCLFVDKEEIGSTGNTGLQSLLIENVVAELLHKTGENDYLAVRKALAASCALSADVNAAIDPNYPEVFEKMNCSMLGNGIVLTKFTGSRGKAESNDANPEYVAAIRQNFDQAEVCWQVGELGKVDIGGGGTVALYMAYYGMEVIDAGVAILGMHSPFEISSKADVYMAYKAYKAFMQDFEGSQRA
ncbi:MAG: aminopeptidase [Bacillota bacterium]|nr:aminopeptidase [Bacillota bacterium]